MELQYFTKDLTAKELIILIQRISKIPTFQGRKVRIKELSSCTGLAVVNITINGYYKIELLDDAVHHIV